MAVVSSTFYMNSPLAACCLSLSGRIFVDVCKAYGGSGSLYFSIE